MERLLQGRLNSEDLAGVHDPVRVKHRFHGLHVFDFNRRAAVGQVVALGHAHAVFGGDRAVVLRHGFEHPLVHGGALGKELVLAQVFRLEDVQVQDAVAEMSFLYGVQWEMVSEMYSRSFHRLCSWVSLWLITPSSTQPCSTQCSKASRAWLATSSVVASNSSSA